MIPVLCISSLITIEHLRHATPARLDTRKRLVFSLPARNERREIWGEATIKNIPLSIQRNFHIDKTCLLSPALSSIPRGGEEEDGAGLRVVDGRPRFARLSFFGDTDYHSEIVPPRSLQKPSQRSRWRSVANTFSLEGLGNCLGVKWVKGG